MSNDKSREAFEADFNKPFWMARNPNGTYNCASVEKRWQQWTKAWNAAQQHQEPRYIPTMDEAKTAMRINAAKVHQEPREVVVHGVCSNKPRPSVQNNHSKGSQHWAKDTWHIRKSGVQTMCGIDSSEWLDIGEITPDSYLCDRCKKLALQPTPAIAGDVERVAKAIAINDYHECGLETLKPITAEVYAETHWADFSGQAKAAIAAMAEQKASDGWRDIASAPKDGTEILAVDDQGTRCVIRWCKHNHIPFGGWIRQIELYGEEVDGFDAVKWQPLPLPPGQNENGGA